MKRGGGRHFGPPAADCTDSVMVAAVLLEPEIEDAELKAEQFTIVAVPERTELVEWAIEQGQ